MTRLLTLILAVLALTGVAMGSADAATPVRGGTYLAAGAHTCTAGFPVRDHAGHWYVVTAGHCIAEGAGHTWKASGSTLGAGYRWEYGGLGTEGATGRGDIGLIRVAGATRTQVVSNGRTQPIVSVKDAKLGEKVCVTAGRTGNTQCGTVISTGTSVSYPSPGLAARTITGLAMVKGICVNPGDSGSPVFAGRSAVGVLTAKSASGCYAWYTKLPAQLRHFGLTVAG